MQYLCEGSCVGKFVSRIQRIRDIEFNYQPPPRHLVPYAAALRGVTKTPPPVTATQHQGSQGFTSSVSPTAAPIALQQQQKAAAARTSPAAGLLPDGSAMASAAMTHHLGLSNAFSDSSMAPRSFAVPAGHHHGHGRSFETMMPSVYFPGEHCQRII